MSSAKPRQTISLFGLLGSDDDSDEENTAPRVQPTPRTQPIQRAPRGVPTISNWRQNSDGSISGFIKNSFSFGEGEDITTSPIRGQAIGGSVIVTASGSR